jgi:hypothetical protein
VLETQIRKLDAKINRRSKEDPVARRLMTMPDTLMPFLNGIGHILRRLITAGKNALFSLGSQWFLISDVLI